MITPQEIGRQWKKRLVGIQERCVEGMAWMGMQNEWVLNAV